VAVQHDPSVKSKPEVDPAIRAKSRELVNVGLAVALIGVGGLLLLGQMTGVDVWRWSWPLIVVIPGLLLLAGPLVWGKGASGLAIPGSIATMTGLVLLYQNTFDQWQTWAYAWALVFPTAWGIGLWLHGVWSGQAEPRETGRRLATIGLLLFLAFGAFFELVLNLSGFASRGAGGVLLALALILGGAFLLARREAAPRS
jgi:hypothetical protein